MFINIDCFSEFASKINKAKDLEETLCCQDLEASHLTRRWLTKNKNIASGDLNAGGDVNEDEKEKKKKKDLNKIKRQKVVSVFFFWSNAFHQRIVSSTWSSK
jgi:hypothetical protein